MKNLQWYTDHSGLRCPFCEEANLKWKDLEWTSEGSEGVVKCLGCGKEWAETHHTVSIVEV